MDTNPIGQSIQKSGGRKLVSIILSFRNEAKTIPEMVDRLEAVLERLPEDYEVIYVNDDSNDESLRLLRKRHTRNARIKIVNLSRRFGLEPGLFAGMACSTGDAVIMLDADLQDPPELIPDLLSLWREGGADIVYTIRKAREGEPWFKMFLTRSAYRIIDLLADVHIPLNAGDFRLVSRRVVDILLRLNEPNTYLRGLVQWVGFKRVPYYYVRKARASGVSHFGALSHGSISTFFYGVTGFSVVPVYAIVVTGVIFATIATLWLLTLAILELFRVPSSMVLWLIPSALWLWSVLLGAVGVVGLYVTRIFRTTLERPRYLVDSTIGIDPLMQRRVVDFAKIGCSESYSN